MDQNAIALVAAAVFAYALFSRVLERSPLTLPIAFAVFGWMISAGGLDIAPVEIGHGAIHVIAELTLILVLFSDAARIDVKALLKDHDLPLRMLLVGMPLTILLGAALAYLVFPAGGLAMAFLIAAILAPTDAALGQSVVSNPVVPQRIRQALNVESGLNDGLAVPFVLGAAVAAGGPGAGGGLSDIGFSAVQQIVFGAIAGLVIGFVGSRLVENGSKQGWISGPFEGIATLAIAVLAFTVARLVGGNGFIAVFAAGLMLGMAVRKHAEFLFEFMESEGQLLTLIVFLIFGAVMVPEALPHLGWRTLLLAVLFLTVVRMVPVAASLAGTGLSPQSLLFVGWFGPRGLASILFALLIAEGQAIDGAAELLASVVLTVALSVLLHGVTAASLAESYGAFVKRRGECAEMEPVSEMRLRHRMMDPAA